MPRVSSLALSIAQLQESEDAGRERFADLCLVLCSDTGDELAMVGGRWDRRLKRYLPGYIPSQIRRLNVHAGQVKAAQWFARWLLCRATGDWTGMKRAWSALFFGGRRGGKSHMGAVALCMFAVMCHGSTCWAVSPTQEETDELEQAIRAILPRSWYRWRGDPKWSFTLTNGTRIFLRSGHKPSTLKRGRCDFALYNEGQKMSQKGYVQIRGATADSGGLTIIAANPPDDPIGAWIEDYYNGALAGTGKREAFAFDPRLNPFIEYESLSDLAHELDDHDYRREVLGEFVPIGHVVFHSWSDFENRRDVPPEFEDITEAYTKEHLGRGLKTIIGADFQKTPHMAAVAMRIYRDPLDEEKRPLPWVIDEYIVEDADEDDLIDAIEEGGYVGADCAVIADASGEWQDAERTKGSGSFDWFRKRGWRWLYQPDAKAKKNPPITERCKVGNALIKSHAGVRRFFVATHCTKTAHAIKHWENRNGAPYRRSIYAHVCDAVTYPLWRFWPRRSAPRKLEFNKVARIKSKREKDLAGF